ncbi:fatty acyl-CoA reductase 1-like [Nylanderia fulva]|uniref:fatty acyl-CoA reductase 1-like n=1 Tax=Nylanderia fulva TaxID=613905 RepID=UPI0010FB951F|nr:fatty acyl-CoA reductase 1-like [Nylanderia fulva]
MLIEKLLRSCPDMQEIFLLMRPKANMCIEEKLEQMLKNRLRSEQPHCLKKLIPLKGDIEIERLGLSFADRNTLIEKVSIIFHVAATVKFDDTLKKAVALVHVSTTYSQVDKPVIDEIVYPTEVDWKKTIQIAETLDEYTFEVFKSKYIGTMPNSYIFTKRLAEQVIFDYSKSLPCVICRPSIITPTLNEPMKGWLDSFNGPVGLMVGCGKGIILVFYNDSFVNDNYVPIDIVTKAMIVAGWKCGIINKNDDTQNILPLVYNCSTTHETNPSRFVLFQISTKILANIPLENMIWAPAMITTKNRFFYKILVLLLHVIPALFIDVLLQFAGKRPRLLKQQRKLFISSELATHFLLNKWVFQNKKLISLSNEVPRNNQRDFGFVTDLDYDKPLYYKNCIIGSKLFLLNESMDRLDAVKFHYRRMLWLDRIVKILVGTLIMWIIYDKY